MLVIGDYTSMAKHFKLTFAQASIGLVAVYLFGGVTFPKFFLTTNSSSAATGKLNSINPPADRNHFPCNVSSAFNSSLSSPITGSLDGLFYCAALKAGTDKIVTHHYQYIYSLYLQHLQSQRMQLLEIGLGCGMGYGPGRSLQLWKDVIPSATVSFLEYDAECAAGFSPVIEGSGGQLYIGSQDNTTLLHQVVQDAYDQSSLYDVIIDDGGHWPTHQLKTLQFLWPALKSGGIYIIEDVMTEYMSAYQTKNNNTLIPWIKKMMELVHCNAPHNAIQSGMSAAYKAQCSGATQMEREVMSINCMVEACVFIKAVPPHKTWLDMQEDWVERMAGWPVVTS